MTDGTGSIFDITATLSFGRYCMAILTAIGVGFGSGWLWCNRGR